MKAYYQGKVYSIGEAKNNNRYIEVDADIELKIGDKLWMDYTAIYCCTCIVTGFGQTYDYNPDNEVFLEEFRPVKRVYLHMNLSLKSLIKGYWSFDSLQEEGEFYEEFHKENNICEGLSRSKKC